VLITDEMYVLTLPARFHLASIFTKPSFKVFIISGFKIILAELRLVEQIWYAKERPQNERPSVLRPAPDKLVLPISTLRIPWFAGSRPNLAVPEMLKGMHIGHLLKSEWYDDFESFRHVNASFNLFGRKFKDFFPETIDLAEDFPTLALQMMFAAQGFFRRKLVTTRNGYLGLGVEAVQPGDNIFILLGSKSPVALRQSPDGYKVVGEIYVHGVMNGEAMKWLERGKCVLEDVVIC
jgi:hypothetical protein